MADQSILISAYRPIDNETRITHLQSGDRANPLVDQRKSQERDLLRGSLGAGSRCYALHIHCHFSEMLHVRSA
jgi:hypothetical protein